MELTIDHHRCDLGDRLPELPKYDVTTLADVDTCRAGRSLKVTLPVTDANDAVTCFARDPYTAARFNETIHTAEITADGALLFAGTARLLSTSETEYVFELRDDGAYWAQQAALAQFNTLAVDYQASLTPTTILDSWTDDTPVRFFPVHRDEYPRASNPTDLLPVERMLSVDDYRPFLHIGTLLSAIFEKAGYRIESRFLQSDFFRSLYMSGAYASHDTTTTRPMGCSQSGSDNS